MQQNIIDFSTHTHVEKLADGGSTVSPGEMLCGPQTVFLLDSVSTGLDSSTTFDIMNTLKVSATCLCSFFVFLGLETLLAVSVSWH